MELLSLVDDDLVIAKLDHYYLLLVHPNKRKYGLTWNDASTYCQTLGKDYFLPYEEELRYIHSNGDDLKFVETILFEDEKGALENITKNNYWNYSWVWTTNIFNKPDAINFQEFILNCGYRDSDVNINSSVCWTLPVRRIKC